MKRLLSSLAVCLGVVGLVVLVLGTGGVEKQAFGKGWRLR